MVCCYYTVVPGWQILYMFLHTVTLEMCSSKHKHNYTALYVFTLEHGETHEVEHVM